MRTCVICGPLLVVLLANHGLGNDLSDEIPLLVRQLGADRAPERVEAEKQLLKLAGKTAADNDRFLDALPQPTLQMPLGVRERLERIRQRVEQRAAEAVMAPSRVTLDADNMPLAEVLAAIETQTGNRLSDHRVQFGQDAEAVRVTLKIDDAPFWFAVDQVLDATGLDVYSFAGDDALALVGRDDGARSRHGHGYLSGPFRFEVFEVRAIRDLRSPDDHALNVGLDVAWEPRLRPIALSQPLKDVAAIGDNGRPLTVKSQRPVLDVEVPAGNQATMFVLPLNLPSRNVKTITQINGKMTALVPGRRVVFRFADLEAMTAADAKSLTQSRGGVHVTLAAVRKSGAIWEVHMRLRLDDANAALESHRGWVFQNVTYMIDGDGNEIEHAGFETTRQTESEVGCAYLFDVPEEIANYTWVYETPAAIVEFPVEYELRDIPLP